MWIGSPGEGTLRFAPWCFQDQVNIPQELTFGPLAYDLPEPPYWDTNTREMEEGHAGEVHGEFLESRVGGRTGLIGGVRGHAGRGAPNLGVDGLLDGVGAAGGSVELAELDGGRAVVVGPGDRRQALAARGLVVRVGVEGHPRER